MQVYGLSTEHEFNQNIDRHTGIYLSEESRADALRDFASELYDETVEELIANGLVVLFTTDVL